MMKPTVGKWLRRWPVFGFQEALVNGRAENDMAAAADTLGGWLQPGHELRIIALGGESEEFLHIGYHGEWLG